MIDLIRHYGLALVFANVLLERAGLPLPAMPTLLLCGALVADGKLAGGAVFVVAVLACNIGDSLWYLAGRVYGRRIMRLLCRVSLSPDSCVRTTESRFERWGKLTLIPAKFVPGLSTVARPLAGALKLDLGSFELLNGIGSVLWVGLTLAAGVLLHAQINAVLADVRSLGAVAGELAALALLAYIGSRLGMTSRSVSGEAVRPKRRPCCQSTNVRRRISSRPPRRVASSGGSDRAAAGTSRSR